MYDYIMVRYGDLTLKGRNQKAFKERLNRQLKYKLQGLKVRIEFQHDMIYIKLNEVPTEEVIRVLDTVSGLSSYSKVVKTEYDFVKMGQSAIALIQEESKGRTVTFKVETKRADKSIDLTSPEITKKISSIVLSSVDNLKVDVHNPELILFVEVRRDATYLYVNRIPGMGGFPVGIGGKAMVLLSGGIDSPVSAYLAMKKGLEVECIHYESTPMTSIESAQKVIDLTERLAAYAPELKINLHFVPFQKIHEKIIFHSPESFIITIMRRMMYRIASRIADRQECALLVSGDSIGQVASQTIESMVAIQDVTDKLVVRPLATYDKEEIVRIARKINTFETSNRPFSDCCTVYVPKNPVIKPTIEKAREYESIFDYSELIEEAIEKTITVEIDARKHLDIQFKGLTVEESLR